jgi:hypothetical protein
MGDGRGRVNPAPRRTAARSGEKAKRLVYFVFFFDIFVFFTGV